MRGVCVVLSAFLVWTAVCVHAAPQTSEATSASKYKKDLSDSASNIQKNQALYSFDLKGFKGVIVPIMEAEDPNCGDAMGDSVCGRRIQGLLLAFIVPIVVGIISLVLWTCFAYARGCCKCCCNNCGGKKSTTQGEYTKIQRYIVVLLPYFVMAIILILFAAFGLDAGTNVDENIESVKNSIVDFLDSTAEFLGSLNTFVDVQANNVKGSVDRLQTNLTTTRNTLVSSVATLQSEVNSLYVTLDTMNTNTQSVTGSPCSICLTNRNAMNGSLNSLNEFDQKNTSMAITGASVTSKIDSQTDSMQSSVKDAQKSIRDLQKDVNDGRDNIKDTEKNIELVFTIIFSIVVVVPALTGLGFIFRKKLCWWCPFWIGIYMMALMWLMLGIFYPISYLNREICSILPHSGGKENHVLANELSGSTKRQYNSFVDTCVQADTGSLFDVFEINSTVFKTTLDEFSLSKQINLGSITDTWNTSALDTVEKNQQGIQDLNLTTVIGDATVLSTAATNLQTINTAYSGHKTYTYSDVDQACTSSAPSAVTCGTAETNARTALLPINAVQKNIDSAKAANTAVLNANAAMSSSVEAVKAAAKAGEAEMDSLINSVYNGFLGLGACDWLGKGYANLRSSYCDTVGVDLQVMWLSCAVIGVVLQWYPCMLVRAEKRFPRRRGDRTEATRNENVAAAAQSYDLTQKEMKKMKGSEHQVFAGVTLGSSPQQAPIPAVMAAPVAGEMSTVPAVVDVPSQFPVAVPQLAAGGQVPPAYPAGAPVVNPTAPPVNPNYRPSDGNLGVV